MEQLQIYHSSSSICFLCHSVLSTPFGTHYINLGYSLNFAIVTFNFTKINENTKININLSSAEGYREFNASWFKVFYNLKFVDVNFFVNFFWSNTISHTFKIIIFTSCLQSALFQILKVSANISLKMICQSCQLLCQMFSWHRYFINFLLHTKSFKKSFYGASPPHIFVINTMRNIKQKPSLYH